jgi:hypothetical protein
MVSAIRNAFSGAKPNDVSLFYFSGQGMNAVNTSYHGALVGTGRTYLSVAHLKTVLDQIPGKKIVIIDSAHSGQMIGRSGGETTVSTGELNAFNRNVVMAFSAQSRGENDLANSGYYVITAAHSTEESVSTGYDEDRDGKVDRYFGLFTYALLHGNGYNLATQKNISALNADLDSNREITLYEAYVYAKTLAQRSNPNQTAQIYPTNSGFKIWAK